MNMHNKHYRAVRSHKDPQLFESYMAAETHKKKMFLTAV